MISSLSPYPSARIRLRWQRQSIGQLLRSYLPADDQVCGISVQGGLEHTLGQGDDMRWIINPKQLVLTVSWLVPSSTVSLSGSKGSLKAGNPFGIAPMGVGTLLSVTTVVITREKGNVGDDFMIEGVHQVACPPACGAVSRPSHIS